MTISIWYVLPQFIFPYAYLAWRELRAKEYSQAAMTLALFVLSIGYTVAMASK